MESYFLNLIILVTLFSKVSITIIIFLPLSVEVTKELRKFVILIDYFLQAIQLIMVLVEHDLLYKTTIVLNAVIFCLRFLWLVYSIIVIFKKLWNALFVCVCVCACLYSGVRKVCNTHMMFISLGMSLVLLFVIFNINT